MRPQSPWFRLPANRLVLWAALLLAWLMAGSRPALATDLAMLATPELSGKPQITEVLVKKQDRRMFLLAGDEVVRSYRIGLGDNPSGHKLHEGDERTP